MASILHASVSSLVLPRGFNGNGFVTTDGLQMGRWTKPKSHKNSAKWDKYVTRTNPPCCAESKAGLFYSLDLSDSLMILSWGVRLSLRKYKVSILKPCICCAWHLKTAVFGASMGLKNKHFLFKFQILEQISDSRLKLKRQRARIRGQGENATDGREY